MKRILIPILLFSCSSYAAGIQKWVDENGMVHYGDSPPAKTKTESITVSRPPSNPGKPLPRFSTSTDAQKKNDDQATRQSHDKTTQEVNKEVCERARKDLQVIDGNELIRLRQADGTERVLTDEEITQRRQQIDNDIKKYCQ